MILHNQDYVHDYADDDDDDDDDDDARDQRTRKHNMKLFRNHVLTSVNSTKLVNIFSRRIVQC